MNVARVMEPEVAEAEVVAPKGITDPFFEVVKTPLFFDFQGRSVRTEQSALVHPDTGVVMGTVTDKYKVLENRTLADLFDGVFADAEILSVKDHLNNNGSRWTRELVLADDRFSFDIQGKDHMKTKVNLYNSYDGKNAVGYQITAWRLVCSNGMFGWRKVFGGSFSHLENETVERTKKQFEMQFNRFTGMWEVWNQWSVMPFNQYDFNKFIDSHTDYGQMEQLEVLDGVVLEMKPGKREGIYLSERQGEKIKAAYPRLMNHFREEETVFGALNVLTALGTHETKALSGSYLYGNSYALINRLAQDFYRLHGQQ